MKKLFLVIILAVAGVVASAQRPDSLPIGTPEKVIAQQKDDVNWARIEIHEVVSDSPRQTRRLDTRSMPYSYWQYGEQESFIEEFAAVVLEYFIQNNLHLGRDRFVVKYVLGNADPGRGEGSMWGDSPDFTLGVGIIPPEATNFTLNYFQSSEVVKVPGVKWVEIVTRFVGGQNLGWISRNGSRLDCWTVNQFGNGYIYLPAGVMAGDSIRDIRDNGGNFDAEVILFYDEEKTDYDRFDVLTGQRIFSSKIFLTMTVAEGKPQVLVRGNPGQAYVLEASTNLTWKSISTLGTAVAYANGIAKFTELPAAGNCQFFRARLATPEETRVALQNLKP